MFRNFDLWECLAKTIDSFILVYIPYRVFPMRHASCNRRRVFLLSFLAVSAIIYGVHMFFRPAPFLYILLLQLVVAMVYAHFFYQGRFFLKMIVQNACVCCCMLLHFIAGLSLIAVTGSRALQWVEVLIVGVLVIPFIYFMIRITLIPKVDLPSYYSASAAFLMLGLALLTNFFFPLFRGRPEVIAITLLMILFSYFLFFRMAKEYEGKSEYMLMIRQMDFQKRYIDELIENHKDIRRMRHELKNHVFCMNALLEQNKCDELRTYFNQVYRQEYTLDLIESGNNIINSILDQKAVYAKSKKIDIDMCASLPETLDIDESDVCAVISNLLDNAIEACERLPAPRMPRISIAVQQSGKYLHIVIKNTVSRDVVKDNPLLATTKPAPHHGVGLQVVNNVVKRHDGIIDYQMEDMTFVVTVMLRIGT